MLRSIKPTPQRRWQDRISSVSSPGEYCPDIFNSGAESKQVGTPKEAS
jgi:hypothetical protein